MSLQMLRYLREASGDLLRGPRAALAALSILIAVSMGARGGEVLISEFMASGGGELLDEDGESSDWFEIYNAGASAVNLGGWSATDDPTDLRKWRFPAVELPPGGYLVVFASGKNRASAGSPLHANFRLEEQGEYFALVRPDGSIADEYAPAYPAQRRGISYGVFMGGTELVPLGAEASFFVPRDGSLGLEWTSPSFVPPPAWAAGPTGLGYYSATEGELDPDIVSAWGLDGDLRDRGIGNDLVYRGGTSPNWIAGRDGRANGAIELGGSDYLEVQIAEGLPIFNAPEYTIAMWVRGLPQPDRRVYSEGSTASNTPLFTIGTDNSGTTGAVDIFIRGPGSEAILDHRKSARAAFDGHWHHLAWVDRNGSAALYIDGVRDSVSFQYSKMSLPLNVAAVGAVLRAAPSHTFTGAIDEVAIWRVALTDSEISDLAQGRWTPEGNPYAGLFATDVGAALEGVNASLYARIPFFVDDPLAFASLELRVAYDDGFVAFLNGTEVARRNAPPGLLAWNSAAAAERDPWTARASERIALAEFVGLLRPGQNALAFQALNSSAGDKDFLLAPELLGISGIGGERRYFREPTPGAPNAGGVLGFVEDTKFSVKRGFYDQPFFVEIWTETPGATIRYTTDQSWPSATHGTVYTGPILIETTTSLRAAAFRDGYEPSDVDTQTYIFLDHVLRQPASPPGYPTVWQGYPADYAMDPEICTRTDSPHYAPTLKDDLRSVPTMSLVIDRDDWMGPTRGIYTHSLSRGVAWERPASLELIYPDGSEESFHVNCGVRMQGGSSARPGEGKHSFRLLFKAQYGDTKLRHRLFRDASTSEFDTIILRCFSTDSWHFKDGGARYRRWDSQFIRDIWMRDSQLAMGHVSSHSTYVHLYVNGMYWGLYNPSERPDEDFLVSYFGGREEDWDIVKDFNELFRGTWDSWNQLMSMANAGLGSMEAYQRIQGNLPDGTRNPAYPVLLDVDNLIDYMILHIFACAEDWPHHNWYAARNRSGEFGGWRFFVWDQEIVLDFVFRDRTGVSNDNSPAKLYSSLRANPEFRMRFADRIQKHLFNGGALAVEEARKRWLRRADEIDRAVIAESARWGDYRMDVPDPSNSPAELYTREDHWLPEKAKVLEQYIPESHRLALERFRAAGLFPSVEAPRFQQHGGVIPEGFELEITAPAGTVYYTLDGSDPRLPGGQVSPAARAVGDSTGGVLVRSGAQCRALVPSGELPPGWTLPGFSDGDWISGKTGVGFERSTGYESLIGTDVSAAMDGVNCSVLIRIPFQLGEVPSGELTLRVKYDDGFVAYLNGREVARANAPAELRWNSEASNPHPDADALVFEDFPLGPAEALLRQGENVLAIHGLNAGLTSGDFLILPELVSSESSGSAIRISTPTVVKARAFAGSWSPLVEAFFYPDIPLRVTEIMYHPPPGPEGGFFSDEDYEFIEFQNVGGRALNLRGIRLLGAARHDFLTDLQLAPGQVALLVRNLSAFSERYPSAVRWVVGEYAGRLDNMGERIYLEGPAGEPILDFWYDDRWYPETDGGGRSLVTADASAPRERWAEKVGWLPSEAAGGSPGFVEHGPERRAGLQLPGDASQDGSLDLTDAIRALIVLFLGGDVELPCEGAPTAGGNLLLFDVNGDRSFNLSDPVYLLNYLFLGGPPPSLGTGCVWIEGCPDACR